MKPEFPSLRSDPRGPYFDAVWRDALEAAERHWWVAGTRYGIKVGLVWGVLIGAAAVVGALLLGHEIGRQ